MASSSVSQESLDMDDFDTMARRNRIRTHRGRAMPHRSGEREGAGDFHDRDGRDRDHQNGDTGDTALGDHESPTRSAAARIKDKQRSRANHTHKGKPGPKDKRKLREKRRSTGVVHLPSTESTGDSLDDDEDDENILNHETKKIQLLMRAAPLTLTHPHHGHPHHSFESRHSSSNFSTRGNKSPSDLEADLEDNQDYDSTVSHSETNLTLIGRSESSDTQMSSGLIVSPGSFCSLQIFPEASRASSGYRYGANAQVSSADQEFSKTPSSSATTKSSVASLVSRYTKEREPASVYQRDSEVVSRDSGSSRATGFGAQKDSGAGRSERSFGSHLPSRFQERERESSGMGSNSSGSSAGGSYQSSRFAFQTQRPLLNQNNTNTDNSAHLEKQLEKEKEENKKLQQQLEQKDRRIVELERQVAMLNRECDELDEDNLKLQEENKALIRAMQQLSTNV